jgi:hypothetical protein
MATRELKQQPKELEIETGKLDSIFRDNSASILGLLMATKLRNPRELETAYARVLKIAFIKTRPIYYCIIY